MERARFAGERADPPPALAGAIVHDVLQRFGPGVCAEILMRVRRGATFDTAFNAATGVTLDEIMEATGCQKHTVRGFVSILGSKGGEKIESSKNAAGERTYKSQSSPPRFVSPQRRVALPGRRSCFRVQGNRTPRPPVEFTQCNQSRPTTDSRPGC